jgi:hypothetical protein
MSQKAFSHPVLIRSFDAGSDLSSYQYYAVKLSDEDTVALAGANEKVVGILLNKPESGEEARVGTIGVFPHIMNEAAAVGKLVTATSGGKGEIADAAGEFCYGIVVQAATAQNDIVSIEMAKFTAHASDA